MITPDWDSQSGVMHRYERKDVGSPWQRLGNPLHGMVGIKGMAWGSAPDNAKDLQYPEQGRLKKESDGRTPAGVFRLGPILGYSLPEQMSVIKTPYLHLTASTLCIDDSRSAYCSRIVDEVSVEKPDSRSYERMRRSDGLYRLGIVVEYNTESHEPGKGSCIFLHIRRYPAAPTSGCTAPAKTDIETILHWLDSKKAPMLAQLPRAEYLRLRERRSLP